MNAAEVPTGQLVAGLRAHAAGDLTAVAAVELLIAHGHWLDRAPFRELTEWWPGDEHPAFAAPDWGRLDNLAHHPHGQPARLGPVFDTGSELGVLKVACSLAAGWLGETVTSCDRTNVRLLAAAVLAAGGAR
ncbi:hypothetical protein ACFQE5_22080 [Pseudonocardia hispaniensis]|uniref:Uncharacterized protein n=1 Tax=Pseudonocardia hispaniensis TaxID=904933 RepID=A0ABW1J8A4_9PSEU